MPRLPAASIGFYDPDAAKRWIWEVMAGSPNTPTIASFGVAPPSETGKPTSTTTDAYGEWNEYTTNTPTQALAGWLPNNPAVYNMVQAQWNPVLTMIVQFPHAAGPGYPESDLTNVFAWFGWTSTSYITSTASPGPYGSIAAFLYSSAISSGNWQCVLNANGYNSTTAYIYDTGIPVKVATKYKLKIDCQGIALNAMGNLIGGVDFWINGQLVLSSSGYTHVVPYPSNGLGAVLFTSTQDSDQKHLRISTAEARWAA